MPETPYQEFLRGCYTRIVFPTFKYEATGEGRAVLMDPSGELEVITDYLAETSFIDPRRIQDGCRIFNIIIDFVPKDDDLFLTYLTTERRCEALIH